MADAVVVLDSGSCSIRAGYANAEDKPPVVWAGTGLNGNYRIHTYLEAHFFLASMSGCFFLSHPASTNVIRKVGNAKGRLLLLHLFLDNKLLQFILSKIGMLIRVSTNTGTLKGCRVD